MCHPCTQCMQNKTPNKLKDCFSMVSLEMISWLQRLQSHVALWDQEIIWYRTPIKCHECLNKLGHTLDHAVKNRIQCNISHIDLRDEGGLTWPSKIEVLICGIVINIFERFLNSDSLKNDYFASCSSSRVALLTFKEMVQEVISNSHTFNVFKGVDVPYHLFPSTWLGSAPRERTNNPNI